MLMHNVHNAQPFDTNTHLLDIDARPPDPMLVHQMLLHIHQMLMHIHQVLAHIYQMLMYIHQTLRFVHPRLGRTCRIS